MMSDKSTPSSSIEHTGTNNKKSKIPRFLGKSQQMTSKLPVPKSRSGGDNVVRSHSKYIQRHDDIKERSGNGKVIQEPEDVLFEPDQKALESILNNEGITPRISNKSGTATPKTGKISSVFSSVPSRMSMWESHMEFKKNLKLYKEKMSFFSGAKDLEDERKVLCGTSHDQANSLTPGQNVKRSSIYYQPPAQRVSMIQSLQEHKENMKVFREKMQQMSDGHQTPQKYGGITPKHLGKTNPSTLRNGSALRQTTVSVKTPKQRTTHIIERPWSESKENRAPVNKSMQPVAYSASKLHSSKVMNKKLSRPPEVKKFTTSSVKRQLLPAVNEAEETITIQTSVPHKDVRPCMPQDLSSVPHVIGNEPSDCPTSQTSSSVPVTASVEPTATTQSSVLHPLMQSTSSKTSAPDICVPRKETSTHLTLSTWSAQNVICTPTQTANKYVFSHARSETPQFSTCNKENTDIVTSVTTSTSSGIGTYGASNIFPDAPSSTEDTTEKYNDHSTSVTLKSTDMSGASLLPSCLTSNTDIITEMNNLTLGVPSYLRTPQSYGERQFPQPAQLYGTPTLNLHSAIYTPSPLPSRTPRLMLPSSQASRVLTDQKSPVSAIREPVTPVIDKYLSQPPMRTPALSSCLKNKSKDHLPARKAVTSVKKLRWADSNSPSSSFK